MAETLGVVTSILQLVDTALKAREYVKGFVDAPEEQRQLFSDIAALRPLLWELQQRVFAHPSRNNLQQMTPPLTKFEKTMDHLVEKMRPALASSSAWSKFSTQLTWTLYNKKRCILTSINEAEHKRHEAEREKMIDWATSQNFFQRQADIHSTWQPGTGVRLGGNYMVQWNPSMVVNQLRTRFKNTNVGVACVYLNHKETEIQTLPNLLAGLWTQLIVEKPIPSAMHELYNHHRMRRTRPSADEVHYILHDFVTTEYAKVYFIVDALDEYPEDQRDLFLEKLVAMGPAVNVMITSRPHINLVGFFPDLQTVKIRATEDDICRYVDTEILRSQRLLKHVKARPELRNEIRSRVISSADGMFLLVKLHLASLSVKCTVKAVRDALRQLPKGLKLTHVDAMARIDRQGEEDKKIAQLTLTWVANAKRPLLVAELQEALAIEPGTTALDCDNILDIDIILSVCAGLVVVDETIPVVRLIHYTMQHYMDDIQGSQFPDAQTDITSRCLTYLSFKKFEEPHSQDAEDLLLEHPFLAYSQYCLLHASGETEQRLQEEIMKFLDDAPKAEAPSLPWNYPDWLAAASPLWISTASNLGHISRYLLAQDNDQVKNPAVLSVATHYGYLPMVQLLIEYGAEVNSYSGRTCTTAMQVASECGHESIVQLLINGGGEVNARGGEYGTALQTASCAGHHTVAHLKHGADVNSQGGRYGTALQAASFHGHEAVVQLLIDHGADLNVQGGRYGTALRAASYGGHHGVIRLLAQNNADVNFHGTFGSALDVVLYWGHEELVQLLIENGVDVNARRGKDGFGTALQTAAYERNVAVVQLLLKYGADVNLKDGKYGTALQAASHRGDVATVRLLVDHGADVNALGGQYETALRAASCGGHSSAVRLLIESGAEEDFKQWKNRLEWRGRIVQVSMRSRRWRQPLLTSSTSAPGQMFEHNYRKTTKRNI
ncbi:ankyrin repeat-containing domain protein [Mycena maculata]|uniref:Ankyrin repeat-containing domain protein n=1 Tax=Mycena maculata TaxID=230809 RepID=A0AAD7HYC5_9AGAR|nr:ankyrin repeat-containing domain protein [Mycena maculata]